MCKRMLFSYTYFQKSPYRGGNPPPPHPPPAGLIRFGPPLTNPGCTTVTGTAKGHKGPCPAPLIGVKENFKRGSIHRDWYMPLRITYPLTMAFNVQENAVFITRIFNNNKISLPWEEGRRETPLPHAPSPRSVASVLRFAPPPPPPLTNPGCTTVTGTAKGLKGPCPAPLIGVKEIIKRGSRYGIDIMPLRITYPLIMTFNVLKMPF